MFSDRGKKTLKPLLACPNHGIYGEPLETIGKQIIPLSGGIFIVSAFLIMFYKDYTFFCIILSLVFLLGFFSDIKFLSSPKYRFFFQSFIILLFVYFSNLQIYPTRILFLDLALENIWISYFFSTFCWLIIH